MWRCRRRSSRCGRIVAGLGEPGPTMGRAMASISGSPTRARLSRVERPAGKAARLLSGSPPCFLRCSATSASTAARSSTSRSPRATRWSASGRALSRVQAWKAATSWPWSIRPFCSASRPNRRSREGSMVGGIIVSSRAVRLTPAQWFRFQGSEVPDLQFYRRADRIALESSTTDLRTGLLSSAWRMGHDKWLIEGDSIILSSAMSHLECCPQ